MGLVKKSGAWFTVGDIRLGQGRENAKEFLRQNTDVAAALDEQIRSNMLSYNRDAEEEIEDEVGDEPLDEEL
jgi:recombination protein RecA